jgi:hypothetical protein
MDYPIAIFADKDGLRTKLDYGVHDYEAYASYGYSAGSSSA